MDGEFGSSTRLIKGGGGVFEVIVDGELVYSKRALNRFPEASEVAEIIRDR